MGAWSQALWGPPREALSLPHCYPTRGSNSQLVWLPRGCHVRGFGEVLGWQLREQHRVEKAEGIQVSMPCEKVEAWGPGS